MKTISIIVPVYNVKTYIDKCITSLMEQTYQQLEIILIDDGSTDGSGEICDRYAKLDTRIRVEHIQNGGQSNARNVGLSLAKGEYIGFVDSDDYVDANRYEKAIKIMEEEQADIVECNFDGRRLKMENDCVGNEIKIIDGKEGIRQQLDPNHHNSYPTISVWTKVFKKNILEGLTFPAGKIHEEYGFVCEALYRSKCYVYMNEILYHRTLRGDSTTAEKFSLRNFDKLDVMKSRSEFLFHHKEQELYEMSKSAEYNLLLELFYHSKKDQLKEKEKEMVNEIRSQRGNVLKSLLPKKKKIEYCIFFVSKKLYFMLKEAKVARL
ncbi:MAG: glycosyltransferase [Eubacteriales bacterium]